MSHQRRGTFQKVMKQYLQSPAVINVNPRIFNVAKLPFRKNKGKVR